MNARTVSEELQSRRSWTETGESIQRRYGLGAESVQERLPAAMGVRPCVTAKLPVLRPWFWNVDFA